MHVNRRFVATFEMLSPPLLNSRHAPQANPILLAVSYCPCNTPSLPQSSLISVTGANRANTERRFQEGTVKTLEEIQHSISPPPPALRAQLGMKEETKAQRDSNLQSHVARKANRSFRQVPPDTETPNKH